MEQMNTVLITGGAGFIGSALIRLILKETELDVVNVDMLTYAGDLDKLEGWQQDDRHHFFQYDICNQAALGDLLHQYQPQAIIHLAADTHVDRSIHAPDSFVQSNILGTYSLLQATLAYWHSTRRPLRFHHVSSDEVYGSIDEGNFKEESPYLPNSPYAATKAAADHLVRAWHRTYGLPVVSSYSSNNYGPYQYPEKFIPKIISCALSERPIPVYGNGENRRDWLYVEDHARGLLEIVTRGRTGERYNIAGNNEISNLQLVRKICDRLDEVRPRDKGLSYHSLVQFVTDRPGHDLRYALNTDKITAQLAWQPQTDFNKGLYATIDWYLAHPDWWNAKADELGI